MGEGVYEVLGKVIDEESEAKLIDVFGIKLLCYLPSNIVVQKNDYTLGTGTIEINFIIMITSPSPDIKKVFKSSKNKDIFCPPEQVFVDNNFSFLVTIGGHIADSEEEYNDLMSLLKELNEHDYLINQNFCFESSAQKSNSNHATISVDSNIDTFNSVIKDFEPKPSGFSQNDFFIYGRNPRWGIYICEYPTINIIGCEPSLTSLFAKVFKIEGTGFEKLREFITHEYYKKPELLTTLIKNYRLD